MAFATFKDPAGPLYHGLAVAYAVGGYLLGFAALFHGGWVLSIAGTLLLGHAMTIAAYLLHECGHQTIFRLNVHNARLGLLFTWMTGSCYATFEDIRYKHFRHHADNADVMWFDSRAWLAAHPAVARVVTACEWFYIPAQDVLMHVVLAFGAFIIPARRAQRLRNGAMLAIRLTLLGLLAWNWPRVAVGYAVAYLLMMTILRFMDAIQHDYDGTAVLFEDVAMPYRGDRAYEQLHTFSNPLSLRHPWVNLLVLNFGYHNAHHSRPATPWYRLPALHREMFGDDPTRSIPFTAQVRSFHRYRVSRVLNYTDTMTGPEFLALARQGIASGGNAVSFLTPF
jgi:acyl-lipid omega-6 desaturase (Delta-12 desaturase)